MQDRTLPAHQEYDAKSSAFHTLGGVSALRFETQRGQVTVNFETPSTPEKLMTTNENKLAAYPDWNTWKVRACISHAVLFFLSSFGDMSMLTFAF